MLFTQSHIPPEIVDLVIHELQDDVVSLHNCSLVGRAWLTTSRIHIFRVLHILRTEYYISGKGRVTYTEKCYHFLQDAPHILPYIKEIRMIDDLSGGYDNCWVALDPWLHRILPLLIHLEKLYMDSVQMYMMPAELLSSFLALLLLPSLTTVEMVNVTVLIEGMPPFIDLFGPGLRTLILTEIVGLAVLLPPSHNSTGDDDSRPPPRLEHLRLFVSQESLCVILTWFLWRNPTTAFNPATHLRTLQLGPGTWWDIADDELTPLLKEVLSAATSLENFEYCKLSSITPCRILITRS